MCLTHQIPDRAAEAAPAFADRLLQTLNQGALSLMISIGHRTGLFDTMAGMAPSDSQTIADRAGLNERYVREWLGAMTTGGVVGFDPHTGHYHLPAEHAGALTRAAAADNMAVFAQYIGLLGSVEDDVVRCFHEGGGVPYSRYPRFSEVMAEDSGQSVLSALFDHILPLIPGFAERLTDGIQVLDVGCGCGRALNTLAQRYPASRFVGYDLLEDAVETARREARERGLTNVRFEARDLSDFARSAEAEAYDLVTTFDAVHDQARPRSVLSGIHRTLKPQGVYLMQDIHAASRLEGNLEHPLGTLLYTVSCMHCMTVSLAQGGEGLGTMWGREKAKELLHEAGFRTIEIHRLAHDVQNDYYVIRK